MQNVSAKLKWGRANGGVKCKWGRLKLVTFQQITCLL